MDQPFPFGLPGATAFYLTLYLATWALHWAFMHYVAAGSVWVLWGTIDSALFAGNFWRLPATRTILSWLPFLLSMAITAGVAPLLFIQILYSVPFYTSNLLLFWIWLLIIPALIALFYLCYLLQAWADDEGFAWRRVGLAAAACGCVALVGGLWIVNHTLANSGPANWTAVYAGEQSAFAWPRILARAMIAIGLAFPGMALIVGWQLWQGTGVDSSDDGSATGSASAEAPASDSSPWQLSIAALVGFGVALVGGSFYYNWVLSDSEQSAILGPFAFSYYVAFLLGAVVQFGVWHIFVVTNRWHWAGLTLATTGYVAMLLSLAVVRESIRLSALGYEDFQKVHERAATIDGLSTFLFFAALNAGLIAFCVWLVMRAEQPKSP